VSKVEQVLKPREFDFEGFIADQDDRDQLRILTCGSVDDGKSTLLGRLLWETNVLSDDQIAAVRQASRRHGTQGDAVDLALLLDGLAAEREQGITIDVAYRFFSTPRRRFIVADTPGHEQYTRNMATGASNADLAILLIDARSGATAQTRRHALIVSMLRVRHVVIAVNKMDLIEWSEATASAISSAVEQLCDGLGFASVTTIPLSALTGDNVVKRSALSPWYHGPTLLEHLQTVSTRAEVQLPFRLAVQWVNRPNPSFRGLAGEVIGGIIRKGDAIRILPSEQAANVARILGPAGDIDEAGLGEAITVVLDRPVDVSRGDVLAEPTRPTKVGRELRARLLWFGDSPSRTNTRYLMKLGTRTVAAQITSVAGRIALETMRNEPAARLSLNDVGDINLSLERSIAYDLYAESRTMGGFLLIDAESFDTIALGLIQAPVVRKNFREPKIRSILKAVSWRALGTVDTIVMAMIFTRNITTSVAIGGGEIVTKTALYYLHERVWARIPPGTSILSPNALRLLRRTGRWFVNKLFA
jgi:sulfate adenylyltransferase large subunit